MPTDLFDKMSKAFLAVFVFYAVIAIGLTGTIIYLLYAAAQWLLGHA